MLTRRGWGVLAAAFLLAFAGRLLGIQELYVLAAAAFVLVVVALWTVRVSPVRLAAARELHPAKVHAGTDSRVELAVVNRASRRTPVLLVRDPFDGGRRQARFLLAPLVPGEVARAAYRLPTNQRGVFSLGPLEVSRTDAFGLAVMNETVASATELTVYPRVDVIAPLPHTIGHDPYAGADHPNAIGLMGEDFYALRNYEVGDDLRRVHWPSTARTGDLMIRQDEMPWQGRVTVVLDARRRAHTPESLELAISAAASILSASWTRRSLVRLVTSDGFDSGWAAGAAHAEALMEHLAALQSSKRDRMADVLAGLRRSGNGGAIALVTAGASGDDLDAAARLRTRFGSVHLVVFEPSSWDPQLASRRAFAPEPSTVAAAGRRGGVIRVTSDAPFAQRWNEAMARSPRASSTGAAVPS
ncbi:MAG TPA: DUF58 domain-containing protein [Acidimicrobiales bacterium]|nr:DUF58 domain-containing protein [Acidimicrobiales bacterium]